VRFVGVDLAWGERRNTGLCALDEVGTVLGSTRARDSAAIRDWVAPYLGSGAVVAVDAPLVVPNDRGCRPCEALVTATFGRREAGAYPANRGNPNFADGGRAWHLAADLGLSVGPACTPRARVDRMIEVYPHTAIVCLFDLDKTIKYKRRRGRAVVQRKACFAELGDLLESLGTREPGLDLAGSSHWRRLRDELAAASSGADLDRAEDEVDAYVCAYVALYYWYWGSARCAVLGDIENGYIVTPVDQEARRRLRGGR
jgi:predicted RNase H-like nuclease